MIADHSKVCRICEVEKPHTEYYLRSNGKVRNECKACSSKAASKNYKKEGVKERHREASRRSSLKRYGITQEVFDEMYNNQNGKCKICSTEVLKIGELGDLARVACVDHCHDSGKVRGILCRACNSGIGHLRDDVNILKLAIEYLESSNG